MAHPVTAATKPSGNVLDARKRALTRAHRAYAAMLLGTITFIFTLWYQVWLDTRRDAIREGDAILEAHRQWRLRTSFVYLMWSILAGFCVPFGFASLVFIPVYCWFVYRVVRGMGALHRRMPPQRHVAVTSTT